MKTHSIAHHMQPVLPSGSENAQKDEIASASHRPSGSGPLSQLSRVKTHYKAKLTTPFDSKNPKPPVDRHATTAQPSTSASQPPAPATTNPASPAETAQGSAPDARHQNLLGQTIAPKVAGKFLKKMEFDGFGRIVSFPAALSNSELTKLEKACIRPLTETNTQGPRDAPRCERDCLMHVIHMTKDLHEPAARSLNQEARLLWLTGVVNQDSLHTLLSKAQAQSGQTPALQNKIKALLHDVGQLKTLPQYHDNLYGRKFETTLVADLVNDPPKGTLAAATRINQEVHHHLDNMPETTAKQIRQKVAEGIRKEPRPWYPLKPAIDKFAASPSMEGFKDVLGTAENGIDVIASINLAHRVWTAGIEPPPWAGDMNAHYNQVLVPQRGKGQYLTEFETNAHGIAALHHPENTTYSTFQTGKSWTYNRSPEMNKPTDFENNTLRNGHIFVSGPSGTTNVLAFTSAHIAQRDPAFSPNDALLAGVMFMTMDTGHSVHEVLATNASIQARETDKTGALLAQSVLPYQTLAELPSSPADRAKVAEAMNRALDQTITHFDNIWSPARVRT